ncbi:hypothetical protein ACTFIY_003098 [Dictyostelium cf. discoideum]
MELETIEYNKTINICENGDSKGVQLTFKNISYKVENKKYNKNKKEKNKNKIDPEFNVNLDNKTENSNEKEITILNNVSGVIEKGELVALMGPSGSGKSTLLDILAQRKSNGKITGQLLVNGKEIGEAYKKYCSYVTQEDVLLQTYTVFETLKFYADLKLASVSEIEKIKRVEKVIEDVGLTLKRDSRVGGVLAGGVAVTGLSGGEKRRVSIGCGLITNPSLIFLDEPTSGLDSVAALQITKTLLNLTLKGVTVICSIHQPRPEIFQLINKVMVIIKGKMIYSGSNILEYFESLGYPCPNNTNPADFCLDSAVEIGEGERYTEICNQWENKLENQLTNEIEYPSLNVDIPKTTSWAYQYWILLNREWRGFIRNKGNALSRVITAIVIGALFGSCFAGLKESDADVQKIMGTLFFLTTGLMLSPFSMITLFLSGRQLFNSERASKIYHSFPYFLSMITVELTIEFFVTLVEVTVCYMLARLRMDAGRFFFAVLVYSFIHSLSTFFISSLANLTGTSDLTFSYASSLSVVFMLFAGFYVPTNELPRAFGWLHWVNPAFYGYSSVVINQFEDLPLKCTDEPCKFTNGNQVIEYYGIEDWTRGGSFGVLVAWATFFYSLSYFALHFLHREKR